MEEGSVPEGGPVQDHFDSIRTLYTVCATCSVALCILFNSVLLWLIFTKTPAPMLVYSKLLMAPCFSDIFFALFTFVVQPIPVVDHGYFAVIQNGFFRKTSAFYNYAANVLWFQMLLLFVCVTTIQFVFRYYMIFSDGRIPAKTKYTTGLTIVLLLCVHVLLHYLSDYPYEHYADEMAKLAQTIYEEVGITDIRFSSFTPARSLIWMLHCAAMSAIFAICYAIMVYCARGTIRYIEKTYAVTVKEGIGAADMKKNVKLLEYNHQITSALIVQAILPTVDVLELVVQTTFPVFFNHGASITYMVYASIPLYFIPVMNPLATMLFVKPYRTAVLRLCGFPRHQSTTRVQIITTHMPQSNPSPAGPTATADPPSRVLYSSQGRLNYHRSYSREAGLPRLAHTSQGRVKQKPFKIITINSTSMASLNL